MNKSKSYSVPICFCLKSLFRIMTYLNKQTVTVLLVAGILCLQLSPLPSFTVNAAATAAAQPRIRPRNNRDPGCNDEQQGKMNQEYQACQHKFTNLHHTNIGSAITTEDHQKYTCQLLNDTVKCDQLMIRCHSQEEVRNVMDAHIVARINQYSDNKDGINVNECPVAKDYLESGRANQVDETTVGACTHLQASAVQNDFQKCSHQLSQKVWEDLQKLTEKKQKERGIQERETNDILEEEERIDELKLDKTETKPMLCKALRDIGQKCTAVITKCFSQEDVEQMRYQHVESMAKYYGTIYDEVDLSDCPALRDFVVSPADVDPCDYPDEQDEFGNYPTNCDDVNDPEINPPINDDDETDGSQIEKSSTSNNILAPTSIPPNIYNAATRATEEDSETKTGELTQASDGYCKNAQFFLVTLSSVILAILCN